MRVSVFSDFVTLSVQRFCHPQGFWPVLVWASLAVFVGPVVPRREARGFGVWKQTTPVGRVTVY